MQATISGHVPPLPCKNSPNRLLSCVPVSGHFPWFAWVRGHSWVRHIELRSRHHVTQHISELALRPCLTLTRALIALRTLPRFSSQHNHHPLYCSCTSYDHHHGRFECASRWHNSRLAACAIGRDVRSVPRKEPPSCCCVCPFSHLTQANQCT